MVIAVYTVSTGAVVARSQTPPGTALFAFHSNQWVNLHHFLYLTARARGGLDLSRPATSAVLADTSGFGTLSAADRAAWSSAVEYYQRVLATRDVVFDSSLIAVNNRLAELEHAPTLRDSGLDPALIAALDAAAPVYRKLWWPRHDQANTRWIARERPLLAQFGDSMAAEETRIFHVPWSSTPIRVDVTAYTNWAGAYTTEHPAHINISSLDASARDTAGLETLFHEVLHTMDGVLLDSLTAAFRGEGKRLPRDPTHPFIFYIAGELTRRRFAGYVPFATAAGLWRRNSDFARMLPLLQTHWQAYMDGRVSLTDALRAIADGF